MFKFFNDKAYKAKWTRELIDRMKTLTRPGSKPGFGLGSMSLPAVGAISVCFIRGGSGISGSNDSREKIWIWT